MSFFPHYFIKTEYYIKYILKKWTTSYWKQNNRSLIITNNNSSVSEEFQAKKCICFKLIQASFSEMTEERQIVEANI